MSSETTRREAILRSAADLLSRQPGANTDDIAKAAGVSRATLHRQFAGRDALVRSLEELGIREVETALDEASLDEGSAIEALHRLAIGIAPSSGLLAFLLSQVQLFDAAQVDPGWERIDARIQALFRRGQQQGEFRVDQDPVWLAEAVYGLFSSAAWCVQAGLMGRAALPGSIIDLMLDGVRRREHS